MTKKLDELKGWKEAKEKARARRVFAAVIVDKSTSEVLHVSLAKTQRDAMAFVYFYVRDHWDIEEDGGPVPPKDTTTEAMIDAVTTYFQKGHGDDWSIVETKLPA